MKLYELSTEYKILLQAAETEAVDNGGEIPEWLYQKLDQIELDLEKKVVSCGHIYKNYIADADAINAEIKKLQERKNSCEKIADSMKRYLETWIPEGSSFKSPSVVIGWRKSKQTVIDDETILPEDYFAVKKEASKTKIKKAIESGLKVPGAHIEDRNNIQIK